MTELVQQRDADLAAVDRLVFAALGPKVLQVKNDLRWKSAVALSGLQQVIADEQAECVAHALRIEGIDRAPIVDQRNSG